MATDEQLLISGGFPVNVPPATNDKVNVAVGGAPTTDGAFNALNNAGSPSTVNLTDLYSPALQKVVGLNIGYSQPNGEVFYGFSTPSRWGTGQQWIDSYYKDPVTWNAVLLASGYYRGKEDPRLGLKADSYANAFGQLLVDSAASKKPITELLGGTYAQYVAAINSGQIDLNAKLGGGGKGGRKRAPLQVEVSNPEDLKEAARQAAVNTLGFTPDDGFLEDFVKTYQGMQTGAQKKAYAGASKVTRPADPTVAAQKELREEYETEASSYGTVQAFDAFLGIIGAK